ncbi:unnamed protein product [Euphydryas editha]|uniref:Endonuclease/exonuclease/phosphatase domain-containing protein n=1 Tax=Euphydryas editha TaxID=104508 RepID=A0AAU9VFF9_EUPED|nr:unnamed protein product [Euphydryas editha]
MSEGGTPPLRWINALKDAEGGRQVSTPAPSAPTSAPICAPPAPTPRIRICHAPEARADKHGAAAATFAAAVDVPTTSAECTKRARSVESSPEFLSNEDEKRPRIGSMSSPPPHSEETTTIKSRAGQPVIAHSQPPISPPHEDQGISNQALVSQESWPRDSTSYAALASMVVESRPPTPTAGPSGVSYAAMAAAPASPRRQTAEPPATQPAAAARTTPRSGYPPITVENLPNWTRHFGNLRGILGHAPNARPLGKGVRFLPKSSEEFRAIQKYLTEAMNQDNTITWYCYSPSAELPTKVAIRGLPIDTPSEEVLAALQELGFPAERAKAIPPAKGRHGCVYFVQLAHLREAELTQLYKVTELLAMPGLVIEAWRGNKLPAQCHRCQAFGHASANCHRKIKCVRCAGEHLARDCPRAREELPTCANCGKAHTAKDRRCAVFKREARKRGISLAPPRPPTAGATKKGAKERPLPSVAQPAETAPTTTEPKQQTPAATGQAKPPTRSADPSKERGTEGAVATRPTTLAPPANEPTVRGQPAKTKAKKRRRKRAPRPARSEPAAASTPQPKPTSAKTVERPQTQQEPGAQEPKAPLRAPATQLRETTDPDTRTIIRVFVEILTNILVAYTQGGIRGYVRELTALVQSQDIHVILLGETRLSEEVEFRIPNFFVYRRDEVSPRGYPYRGTAALVRRDIVHEELEHAPFASVRTQGVRVCAEDEELLLYAAYKPPREAFCSTDVQSLFSSRKPTLVVGDFNAKHPAWGARVVTPAGRQLLEDSVSNGYGIMGPGAPSHIPSDPRRQPDVLDIVLHHGLPYPLDVEVIYDLDTQHLPILVVLTLRRGFTVLRSPRPRVDWERYTSELMGFELTVPISTPAEVEKATETITRAIQKAKEAATSAQGQPRGYRDQLPSSLREKIRRKRQLRRLWTRTRCPRVKHDLNRLAEEVSRALVALDDDNWEVTIDRASEHDLNLYSLCKKLTGNDAPIYPLKDREGNRRYSASDRAEILAEYMEEQFTPNPPNTTNANVVRHHAAVHERVERFLSSPIPSLQDVQLITLSELRKAVLRLPKRKAPGTRRGHQRRVDAAASWMSRSAHENFQWDTPDRTFPRDVENGEDHCSSQSWEGPPSPR